jgi:predicted extracellular nuclease
VASACGTNFTAVYAIQGSGTAAVFLDTRTTEGIVVGDFQGSGRLNGFFIQDPTGDGNTATSDGMFIYEPNALLDVTIGQRVRVTGAVSEFQNLTEITATSIIACGTTATIAPVTVNLPFSSSTDAERYEGMLVAFPQTLTVSETFGLGRYGRVLLSNGRLFIPTNIHRPGTAAQALAAANKLNSILLDDGNTKQNPDPILFPGPSGLTAQNTLRNGYTLTGLVGVLNQNSDGYKIDVMTSPTFNSASNPRPTAANVSGTLRVVSANVENYFNGDGAGGGFPTPRGARNAAEFKRQRDKTLAALKAMNADVIAIMELENDGDGPQSAAQDLLNGLNAVTAPNTYAFITDPASGVGTDQIHVKIFYKPASVTPVGSAMSDSSAIFERKPVAQTFRQNSNGQVFSIIANHFKSKSSCPSSSSDPDADKGDGQGCWNQRRVTQATTLLAFIKTVQTASGDPDVLVVGDLNANAKEDPIDTLTTTGGLINEVARHITNPYSYVFMGESGYLDHALATPSLSAQVVDVIEFHINADEPPVLGYTTQFKTTAQQTSLYNADQYRIADHDPILIGLNLAGSASTPAATAVSTVAATAAPTAIATAAPTAAATANP